MPFFKKNRMCSSCTKLSSRRDLHSFCNSGKDYDSGNEEFLCDTCFLSRVKKSLRNYRSLALSVFPLQKKERWWKKKGGGNAYHFYGFSELEKYNFAKEEIKKIDKILANSKPNCEICNKTTNFVWTSPDLIGHQSCGTFKDSENVLKKSLCNECMAREFTKEINNPKTIRLDNFIAPGDEKSYSSTFEY